MTEKISVRSAGYHSCVRNIFLDLFSGEMPADTGLCALSHFYLDSRAGVQIILMYSETSGSYLHDSVCAVLVEILVQTALAGVVVGAELLGGSCKRLVSIL